MNDHASVLALLKGRRVSLNDAWRVLSSKCFLLKSGVRAYMEWHAWVLMMSDKERLSYAKQRDSQSFMLINEIYYTISFIKTYN
jgi:hypothetical protein